MAQILGMLSRQISPVQGKADIPEVKSEPLVKYSFNVVAVDGSAFIMDVLAPNADVATRFVRRYPGIISCDLVFPEGSA